MFGPLGILRKKSEQSVSNWLKGPMSASDRHQHNRILRLRHAGNGCRRAGSTRHATKFRTPDYKIVCIHDTGSTVRNDPDRSGDLRRSTLYALPLSDPTSVPPSTDLTISVRSRSRARRARGREREIAGYHGIGEAAI